MQLQILPNRLKSARQLRGLSLRELSTKLENKISRQLISKYENGVTAPNHKNLLLLCEALELSLDYFKRPIIAFKEIEFRDSERIPIKERKQTEAKAEEFLGRILDLENVLGADTILKKPFTNRIIKTYQDVEKIAIDLRKEWILGEGPILSVVKLLEEKGIKICEVDTFDDFSGMVARTTVGIYVMVLNKNEGVSIDRKRFTALYELAHILLHFDQGLDEKKKRFYCYYFAKAMLFPKSKVKLEFGGFRKHIPINELIIAKEQYGISIQAILHRLRDLEIITEHHYTLQRKLINEEGWKKIEPGKYYGREQPVRMKQLLLRGISEEIISITKAAELSGLSLSKFRQLLKLPK